MHSEGKTESLRFDICDAFDVAGDPGGHYRHGTVVCGTLTSGILAKKTSLLIPTIHGPCPVTMVGAERHNSVLTMPLAACDNAEPMGIYTTAPALSPEIIERSTATLVGEIDVAMIERLFAVDPRIFIHYQCRDIRYPILCGYCAEPLLSMNNHLSQVRNLSKSEDMQLAGAAQQYVTRYSTPLHVPQPARSWWRKLMDR